jgi:RNA polymerase sigma-70 factor (ECF subfamily)
VAINPQQIASDETLIARIAQGDQQAFRALYDRLSGPLYSLSVKILGNTTDAQDAFQEACVQIWKRAASYDSSKSSVFTWAVLITRSKVIDYLRAKGRQQRVVQDLLGTGEASTSTTTASATENAADILERDDEARRVQAILSQLPADQRQAIELAFFADLTHHDIAGTLGQPLGTIKARIRRGLLRLRDALQRERRI